MKEFLIGSRAFFDKFEDFVPFDTDLLIIDDVQEYEGGFITQSYMEENTHYVRWKAMSKEEFIEIHKAFCKGRYIQKFLVPSFVEYLGLTIDDLKKLSFLLDCLDDEHGYCKTIYDFYIENNDFVLTPEQLNEAYRVYKEERGL